MEKRSLIGLLSLLLSFTGYSQIPIQSIGTTNNRVQIRGQLKVDSALGLPNRKQTSNLMNGGLVYNTTTRLIEYYDTLTARWYQLSTTNLSDGVLSGGTVSWTGSGLNFYVSSANYVLGGVLYTSSDTTVTLSASDPDSARIDVIALNTSGVVTLTGTPSSNPSKPQVTIGSQLELTSVLINAGSTTPSGITQTVLWDENTESTVASSLTVNADNTNNPFHLVKAVDLSSHLSGGGISFTLPSTIDLTDQSVLVLYVRLKSAYPTTTKINISFLKEIIEWSTVSYESVSNNLTFGSGEYGYLASTVNAYQVIQIPMSAFTFISSPSTIKKMDITLTGAGGGAYIDYVQVQSGVSVSTSGVNTFNGRTGNVSPEKADYSQWFLDTIYRRADSVFGVKNGVEYLQFKDSTGGGGSMIYPGAGIPLSNGTGWLTSITNNSALWNAATDTTRFKDSLAVHNTKIDAIRASLDSVMTFTIDKTRDSLGWIKPSGAFILKSFGFDNTTEIVHYRPAGSNNDSVNVYADSLNNASITNAKLATMPAHTYKGNKTAGAATPTDLTASELFTELKITDSLDVVRTALNGKQPTLVSGTNIKTVNGNSLLGSGDVVISGGSSQILLSDLGRLPKITVDYSAKGVTASGTTITNYPASSVDSNNYYFTTINGFTDGSKYGGVLWNTPIGDSILVTAPFGVVYGSSFSEGHKNLHGRLHYIGGTFDPNYPDSAGQMSYHLRLLTGYRWYNHGIGGQTTTQARQRWARDVLAKSTYSTDGRPAQTLSRKPFIVFFDGAGNDPYTPGMTPEITMKNIEWMAQSAQENNIRFIVCNSPQGPGTTRNGSTYLTAVNKWLESGSLDRYGAVVFDLKSFWSDPAFGYDGVHGNATLLNPVDNVHFSNTVGTGYDSLSRVVVRVCKIPILTKVAFLNEIAPTSPVTNFAYVDSLTIDGVAHKLTKQSDTIAFTGAMTKDSVWIKARHITTVAGAGTQYGYSHIDWVMDNNFSNPNDSFYTRKTLMWGTGSDQPYVSKITVMPEDVDGLPVFRVMNSTKNETDYSLAATADGRVYINQFGGLTTYNSSKLNVTGGIGTSGSIYSTNATHQFGNFQFIQNASATATGTGISIFNTTSSTSRMWFQTTSGGNNFQTEFKYYTPTILGWPTTTGFEAGGMRINYGLGAATALDSRYSQLLIDPAYNQTTSGLTSVIIRGIYYNPTLTSMTNVKHFGLLFTSGDNYLNTVSGTTCIGCDVSANNPYKLQVNGSIAANKDSLPLIAAGTVYQSLMIDTTTGKFHRSNSATIADGSITNAKLSNRPASTFMGAIIAGAPVDLTVTEATAMLNTFSSTLKGLAPSSGGGTANFLRADGTWAVPPGTPTSGTYTPTETDIANIATSTSNLATYMQVGLVVHVSGSIAITATAAATTSSIDITLPVGTVLTSTTELNGTANSDTVFGYVTGQTTDHKARITFTSPVTGSVGTIRYTFSYLVTN